MKVHLDILSNLIIKRGWINKILVIILGILLVNLCREYIWVEPPTVKSPRFEPSLSLDFNVQNKDWSYYKDVFTPIPKSLVLGFTNQEKALALGGFSAPLVLKGTVISNPNRSFAIIEDLGTGVQDLYSLGDIVCGAKIIAMNRNRVVVEYNSQKQELKMNESMNEVAPRSSLVMSEEQPRSSEPAVDFSKLLTQVRIKPYFEGGRCIGFQVSSIRNGSLVEKLGLREGDIIETINGVRVDDPLKALQLLYAIERSAPVHLGIERQDKKMELDCRIEG